MMPLADLFVDVCARVDDAPKAAAIAVPRRPDPAPAAPTPRC